MLTLPLVAGTWQLRNNFSMYDACYVALADTLHCALITGDARVARAPGIPVPVVVP
jgi:predicted nucleic acid-binding protein